jgi:hypothetical protein
MTDTTTTAMATPPAAHHTPPVHQHDAHAHAMFRSARDLLLQYRSDQAGALRQYQPPRPEHFNWALDWFDVVAATAETTSPAVCAPGQAPAARGAPGRDAVRPDRCRAAGPGGPQLPGHLAGQRRGALIHRRLPRLRRPGCCLTGRRADDGPPRGRRHRDPALATTRMVAQPAWDAVGPGCSHDAATRILFIGLWGLASILVLDWFLAVTALHENGPIAEP